MDNKIAVMGTGDEQVDMTDLPTPITETMSEGFQPILEQVPNAVFPDTPHNRDITINAYVEAGRRLVEKDYAALYINTMGDYGLNILRQEFDIPITGSGEASIREARSIGESFSIVTIWPPRMKFIYDHILNESNANGTCRQIYFLSTDQELMTMGHGDDFYTNMRTCQITSLTTIKTVIEQSLQNDGVGSVILGCTCMSHLGPILKAEGYPVIEPMEAGYKYAEFLAKP